MADNRLIADSHTRSTAAVAESFVSHSTREREQDHCDADSTVLEGTSAIDFAALRLSDDFNARRHGRDRGDDVFAAAQELDTMSQTGSVSSFSSTSDLLTMKVNAARTPMSITFAKDVRLEDGSVLRVGCSPADTSEHASLKPRYNRVQSESGISLFDRRTGTPTGRKGVGHGSIRQSLRTPQYRKGERRHPLLQSTVDELALNGTGEDKDTLPPLDTNIHESPRERSPATGFLGSRSLSFRSRKGSEMASGSGSAGRRRRSSTRMSPAQSFLMGFGAKQSGPPRPDDEGQEISDSKYIIGKQIGYGGFSVVKEVFTFEDGARIKRAVKIVYKEIKDVDDEENEKVQEAFEHEVSIWRYLHHPHLLPLIEVHDTPFATFCITKLNEGGTLFDLVRARRRLPREEWALPAGLAKHYLYQLAGALRYLHEDMHIVHRDVKLENCLLDMSGNEEQRQDSPVRHADPEAGSLLLCDFGLADFTHPDSRDTLDYLELAKVGPSKTSTSVLGSINYIAPEVIASNTGPLYHPGLDIWAFGVVAYTLLTGDLPFRNEYQPALVLSIERGDYESEPLENCSAGPHAVEMVQACLQVRVEDRWDINTLLASVWFDEVRQEEDG